MTFDDEAHGLLRRVAEALERLAPTAPEVDLSDGDAWVWHSDPDGLQAVAKVSRVDIGLLRGIDSQRDALLDNTLRFAKRLPANNALLWGARGTGKSSLVKAVHAETNKQIPRALGLIEIHREDIASLPRLLAQLSRSRRRFVLYCDDLSFEGGDTTYKSLKAVLEGGVEGRPENVIFYATSNRRHLISREMVENESASAIIPGEATDEKVSLSDRFGLWLGFHHLDQPTYLEIIDGYAHAHGLAIAPAELHARAVEWAVGRGARSGRVAWQFIQDLAGRLGRSLDG